MNEEAKAQLIEILRRALTGATDCRNRLNIIEKAMEVTHPGFFSEYCRRKENHSQDDISTKYISEALTRLGDTLKNSS